MSRIVVIGNSHIGAVRHAWSALPAAERRHDVRFFAAHGPHFRKLSLTPELRFGLTRRRVNAEPETAKRVCEINGAPRIDLSRSDLVVWGGYLWPLTPIARLMAGFDIDGLRDVGADCRLSRPAFDAICSEFVNARLPRERWRNWSRPKLALLMRPTPVEVCIEGRNPVYRPWEAILRKPAGARPVLDTFLDRFETAVSEFGIRLLRQPPETQADSGLTRLEFSRQFPNKLSEYNHMNLAYGALCLRSILDCADALAGSAPVPVSEIRLAAGAAR